MEATIVCVDNSEWTRNGDFSPDRFHAQTTAINFLAEAKKQDNPENGIGLLTMAGKSPQVLVTPTSDLNKVFKCTSSLSISGDSTNIRTSVQVAQLALKHRPNKNQRQRIVLFSGSPVTESKESLLEIARELKKTNVAIDIVCFGCDNESTEKLRAFLNAVQNSDNSHFVEIQQGAILSDALIGTPIFMGENAAFGAGAVGVDGEFAVDPNMDPELALALRVSMEEERERQNRAAAAAANEGSSSAPQEQQETEETSTNVEDNLLQEIAMTMKKAEDESMVKESGDAIEDEEIQAALRMSLEDHTVRETEYRLSIRGIGFIKG